LIPWIDVEFINDRAGISLADATQRLAMMVLYCEERFGKPIGIYTAVWAWNGLPHANRFAHLPLWVASYGGVPNYPVRPSGWTRHAIHQYSSSGTISGIAGMVDLNVASDLTTITRPGTVDVRGQIQHSLITIREELAKVDQLLAEL
jgi:GH25 family lysozyme M1 (1,4-beta-N-acetylmuramidase)